jgi:hypothetical protein
MDMRRNGDEGMSDMWLNWIWISEDFMYTSVSAFLPSVMHAQ